LDNIELVWYEQEGVSLSLDGIRVVLYYSDKDVMNKLS